MTKADLILLVQTRIDTVSSIAQTDPVSPSQIEKELNEAAFQVLTDAKRELVYPAGVFSTPAVFISTLNSAPHSIIIPVDDSFIRFLRAKAYAWRKGVDTLISIESNLYRQQSNPYQRATPDTPVAALIPFYKTQGPEDNLTIYKQAIELFPAPSSLTDYEADGSFTANGSASGLTAYKGTSPSSPKKSVVPELLIVSRQDLDAEDEDAIVPWPEKLLDPISWLAASRCLTSTREESALAAANAAAANYRAVIDGKRIGMKGEDGVPVQ